MNSKLSIVLTLETVVCAEVPTSTTRKLVLFLKKISASVPAHLLLTLPGCRFLQRSQELLSCSRAHSACHAGASASAVIVVACLQANKNTASLTSDSLEKLILIALPSLPCTMRAVHGSVAGLCACWYLDVAGLRLSCLNRCQPHLHWYHSQKSHRLPPFSLQSSVSQK